MLVEGKEDWELNAAAQRGNLFSTSISSKRFVDVTTFSTIYSNFVTIVKMERGEDAIFFTDLFHMLQSQF